MFNFDYAKSYSPHEWRRWVRHLYSWAVRRDQQIDQLMMRVRKLEQDNKDLIACLSIFNSPTPGPMEMDFDYRQLEDRPCDALVIRDGQKRWVRVKFHPTIKWSL